MKAFLRKAALGISTFVLAAPMVPAQNAYWGNADRGAYQTASYGAQHDDDRRSYPDRYYSNDRDRRDGDRGYDDRAYYGDYDRHAGETVAITVGGAAAGALIGGIAGHGEGAAVGAIVGGVAGLIAGESMHHR